MMKYFRYIMVMVTINTLGASEITKYIDVAMVTKDNTLMALSSYAKEEHSISFWSVDGLTFKLIKKFDFDDDNYISDMDFSDDGKYLAAGINKIIYIWDTKTKALVKKINNLHELTIVKFSPTGKYLVAGDDKNRLMSWLVEDNFSFYMQVEGDKAGYKGKYKKDMGINVLAFSPDEKYLAVGFEDKDTQIYQIQSKFKKIATIQNANNPAYEIFFTPNNEYIIISGNNGINEVFNANIPFKRVKIFTAEADELYSATLSTEGRYYITSSDYNGLIQVWDIKKHFKNIVTLKGHNEYTTSLQFIHHNKYIISAGGDDSIKLWEVGKWHEVGSLTIDEKHQFQYKKKR